MKLDEPILTSFLDDDLYKFNMGSVVFHDFPEAIVTYEFTNRGKTEFPPGFDKALNWQLELMAVLAMTHEEYSYLKSVPGMRPTYVEWLMGYRFDPGEVGVQQEGGKLTVFIKGRWYRTIFWEVRLMAVISELYFRMTGQKMDANTFIRMDDKAKEMDGAGAKWADFGTRRRYSFANQDKLVSLHKHAKGFIGTSNVYLAMKHGVKPIGTSAHEMVMGLSAKYGVKMANKMWSKHWSEHFNGLNGIALTDTFTSDVFLRDWDSYYARLFDGVRQDSGDPFIWGTNMLKHYSKLGIDTKTKKFVFSDGLTPDTFINLHEYFKMNVQVIGGIGTNLTNDCGKHVKPLNMVIKMRTADFGQGPVEVVKLPDNAGKHNGTPETIAHVKRELAII